MSTLTALKEARDLEDFAKLLGCKPSLLSFVLYKIPSEEKYTTFEIPKRSGEPRIIKAPIPVLKKMQKTLAGILEVCEAELANTKKLPVLAHGFRKDHSIITNASKHKCRRYVLNADLEDFFPSINFGRVRGFFIKNADYALHEKIATLIAQIACHDHSLPQGSPCSPIISNMISHIMDVRMAGLARRHGMRYTRYADDITFSTNSKIFSEEVAHQSEGAAQWEIGQKLLEKITRSGFNLNQPKFRMHYKISRQTVTGLVVNKKVNVPADYARRARSMCHSFFQNGYFYHQRNPGERYTSIQRLEGVVSYIDQIRSLSDQREELDIKKKPSSSKQLLRKVLAHKYILCNDAPLIMCEGKTDSIYLKCAIKKLVNYHPQLGAVSNGTFKFGVRFFNYSDQAEQVMQLGGGSGDLLHFLTYLKKILPIISKRKAKHPFIILLDNDNGGSGIFAHLRKEYSLAISIETDDPFYHLVENIYVVKLPHQGAQTSVSIEDLFDADLLQTEVGGKKFKKDKKHKEPAFYGKAIFADKVVRANYNQIDFTKFAAVLDRILAVTEDYKGKLA